jgi:hypothetical protein
VDRGALDARNDREVRSDLADDENVMRFDQEIQVE